MRSPCACSQARIRCSGGLRSERCSASCWLRRFSRSNSCSASCSVRDLKAGAGAGNIINNSYAIATIETMQRPTARAWWFVKLCEVTVSGRKGAGTAHDGHGEQAERSPAPAIIHEWTEFCRYFGLEGVRRRPRVRKCRGALLGPVRRVNSCAPRGQRAISMTQHSAHAAAARARLPWRFPA
jgi:hypothetical protein